MSIARSTTSRSRSEFAHCAKGNLPMRTVSATVESKVGSMRLGTNAIFLARSIRRIPRTSSPSSLTLPPSGLRIRFRHLTIVVFPTPFGPMTHTSSGRSSLNDTPSSTGSSLYPNVSPSTSRTVNSRPPCCCGVSGG